MPEVVLSIASTLNAFFQTYGSITAPELHRCDHRLWCRLCPMVVYANLPQAGKRQTRQKEHLLDVVNAVGGMSAPVRSPCIVSLCRMRRAFRLGRLISLELVSSMESCTRLQR